MDSARDAARGAARTDSPLLRMQGVVKRYGATVALDRVDFEASAGEIHALLGENGAGKSTLMHVLAGLTRPDAGEILIEGASTRIPSPRAARALGIAMVHQHFTLVPAFTVAENLALDAGPQRGESLLRWNADLSAESALRRAAALGWTLTPQARIDALSVGAQQRVEIVKALATEARLLIFDEPTAVLAGAEVEELFVVLRRLRDEGHAVILIAHKLAEILAVADRVTVLRRGRRVASSPVAATDARQLAEWMIGPDLPHPFPVEFKGGQGPPEDDGMNSFAIEPSAECPSDTEEAGNGVLSRRDNRRAAPYSEGIHSVTNNSVELPAQDEEAPRSRIKTEIRGRFSDLVVWGDRGEESVRGISLEVGAGEIFGIGGVDGNGQTELAEALAGLRPLAAGSLRWNDGPFRAGVSPTTGYIPQDRRRIGLAVTMTVEENLLFDAVRDPTYHFGPFLRRRALRQLAADLIHAFDIRTPGPTLPVSALSGGNQQKIVVARALRAQPEWIVAVNPTRGLDIGATRFVHAQLQKARLRGAAIVLISTDLDELNALSDRAAIVSGGKLTPYALSATRPTELGLLLGGMIKDEWDRP